MEAGTVGALMLSLLPTAVVIAVSPRAIMAVILMLGSDRPLRSSVAFDAAWMLGLTMVCTLVLLLTSGEDYSSATWASRGTQAFLVAVGVVLMALALLRWRARHQHEPPKLLTRMGSMGPPAAFAAGFALVVASPKNLSLALAAVAAIREANRALGETAVAVAVLVLVASVAVGVPVLMYATSRRRAVPVLRSWMADVAKYGNDVMAVVMGVLAISLLARGATGLAA